ncbi:AMP-binding protein [Streptomyces decoyicus]
MPEIDEELLPLTPPQLSLQQYTDRPFVLELGTPLSVAGLLQRVREVLDATPALRLALRNVTGVRVLRQSPGAIRSEGDHERGGEFSAGALTVAVTPGPDGSRLRLTGDWSLVDRSSLQGFLGALAGVLDTEAQDRLAAVVSAYAQMAKDGELAEEDAYWKAVPADAERDPFELLGTGAEGSAQQHSEPAVRSAALRLTPEAGEALKVLARTWDTTVDDVAYLALSVLASGFTEQPLLGWVCDARATLGLDGLPGAFSQILPDNPVLAPSTPLEQAAQSQGQRLAEHRAKAGGAALGAGSVRPALVFAPGTGWDLPTGWRVEEWCLGVTEAVTLHVVETEAATVLRADAVDGIVDGRLESLLDAWRSVLEHVVEASAGNCGQAGPLTRTGQFVLADTLAAPVEEQPQGLCEAVYAHALAAPDSTAFRVGSAEVGRGELARSTAGVLRELEGIEQGAVVGVLAENGLDLLVGWLAVLWHGAVVLPLSPEEPRQRIEAALASTGAVALLHQAGLAEQAKGLHPRTSDLAVAAASGKAPCGPPADCPGEAPAYLVRTSGSTGEPKVVVVTRDNLDNYLHGISVGLGLGGHPMPWVSAPIFDAGLKQFLGPQYVGGTTVGLTSPRADVEGVARELAEFEVDFELNCVPGYWSALLDAFAEEARPRLRRLFLGGEPVAPGLVARTSSTFAHSEIWNLYGPTETTATATAGRLLPGGQVDVGLPVAGARVLIADRWGRPVPEGFPGEVRVAGPGVAAGYLSDGQVVPFGTMTIGGREIPVYRTGDLGSLVGGRLRLNGRTDRQVKVRGWRIDPQQIESVAERLDGVRARVAVRHGDGTSLHLFYTGPAAEPDMTSHLRAELPAALMPTVTRVPVFPFTPSGKIDERLLLTTMEKTGQVDPEAYTSAERAVAKVWRELLSGGEWPDPEADFFAAGGHSLVLARMVNILRGDGHERLTIRAAMRRPTVRELADLLDLPAARS